MSDINQKWFKRDFWTHQEAACLFHGMNPDSDTLHFIFSPMHQSKDINSMTIETSRIFESADWSRIYSSSTDKEKRNYNDYFQLAKLKNIHVSKQLVDAKDKFEKEGEKRMKKMEKKLAKSGSSKKQSEMLLSGKMLSILKPIINIIEDFKNNPDYKKHGAKIQQQLIDNWLKDQGLNARIRDHLKKLITEYYGIITARK